MEGWGLLFEGEEEGLGWVGGEEGVQDGEEDREAGTLRSRAVIHCACALSSFAKKPVGRGALRSSSPTTRSRTSRNLMPTAVSSFRG